MLHVTVHWPESGSHTQAPETSALWALAGAAYATTPASPSRALTSTAAARRVARLRVGFTRRAPGTVGGSTGQCVIDLDLSGCGKIPGLPSAPSQDRYLDVIFRCAPTGAAAARARPPSQFRQNCALGGRGGRSFGESARREGRPAGDLAGGPAAQVSGSAPVPAYRWVIRR